MGERIKVFVIIAIVGFIGGIIADLTAQYIIPTLTEIVPAFLNIRFVISGLVGALLTIILISVWAYFTRN